MKWAVEDDPNALPTDGGRGQALLPIIILLVYALFLWAVSK